MNTPSKVRLPSASCDVSRRVPASQRIEVYWLRLLAVYMFVAKLNAATVAFPMPSYSCVSELPPMFADDTSLRAL